MPLLLAAAAILLLAGAFAWWKHRPAVTPGSATAPATAPAPAAAKNAIIVADFVNQTGDPVFETTLNQALVVQLGQSPVLDIVSAQHLRQSLQYLGKKPDDAITPAIAREIGEREGIKAILTGTIASLGGDYIITLVRAENSHRRPDCQRADPGVRQGEGAGRTERGRGPDAGQAGGESGQHSEAEYAVWPGNDAVAGGVSCLCAGG